MEISNCYQSPSRVIKVIFTQPFRSLDNYKLIGRSENINLTTHPSYQPIVYIQDATGELYLPLTKEINALGTGCIDIYT